MVDRLLRDLVDALDRCELRTLDWTIVLIGVVFGGYPLVRLLLM